MTLLAEGGSQSAIARQLGRDRSTISRELARNGARRDHDTGAARAYDAIGAGARAQALAAAPGRPKLAPETPLFAIVHEQLREGWSPEQVAGRLQKAFKDDPCRAVCHETIYTAIYVMPRGELRRELIDCLRFAHWPNDASVRKAPIGAAASPTWPASTSARPRSRTGSYPAIGKAI